MRTREAIPGVRRAPRQTGRAAVRDRRCPFATRLGKPSQERAEPTAAAAALDGASLLTCDSNLHFRELTQGLPVRSLADNRMPLRYSAR